jgi:hypothetical protein
VPRETEQWFDAYDRSGIDAAHRLALRHQGRVIEIAPSPCHYNRLQFGLMESFT